MARTDSANCWVYGGKSDEDINVHNHHTVTRLKMVSLYDSMLKAFKHVGQCAVIDSAHMSDAMSGINMVGTCQTDRVALVPWGRLLSRQMKL